MTCGIVSAFGQTFFIALFVPDFARSLDVSEATFGAIYGGVTVGSALLLPVVGPLLDKVRLTRFVTGVFLALAASCVLIAVAPFGFVLVIGLFGVRFTGQGLCGHTWSTSIARYFSHTRGSALALASMGHPIGEGAWPAIFVALIAAVSWRGSWGLAAAVVVLVFLPLALALLSGRNTDPKEFHATVAEDPAPTAFDEVPHLHTNAGRSWTRAEVLRDRRVWLLLPSWFASPFALTGLFFHQVALGEARGFTAAGIAVAFTGYAFARGSGAFLGGALVDKFKAGRVLPFLLVPMGLGFTVAALVGNDVGAIVYLALAGVTLGLGGAVRGAYLAETFGTAHLGAIRSTLGAFAVWSTALGPPLYGYAAEAGIAWEHLLAASTGFLVLASIGAAVGVARLAHITTTTPAA